MDGRKKVSITIPKIFKSVKFFNNFSFLFPS